MKFTEREYTYYAQFHKILHCMNTNEKFRDRDITWKSRGKQGPKIT